LTKDGGRWGNKTYGQGTGRVMGLGFHKVREIF